MGRGEDDKGADGGAREGGGESAKDKREVGGERGSIVMGGERGVLI